MSIRADADAGATTARKLTYRLDERPLPTTLAPSGARFRNFLTGCALIEKHESIQRLARSRGRRSSRGCCDLYAVAAEVEEDGRDVREEGERLAVSVRRVDEGRWLVFVARRKGPNTSKSTTLDYTHRSTTLLIASPLLFSGGSTCVSTQS